MSSDSCATASCLRSMEESAKVLIVIRDNASAVTFSEPDICRISVENCEMNSRCRASRGLYLSSFDFIAKTKGMWSVFIENIRPSTKYLNLRTAKYIARSSRLKAEYFCSVAENFLEKKASGCQISLWHCCKTAPTAKSEASTCMRVGAVGEG